MYGAEVFDGETARFEVELSEDDVHGQWRLNGEILSPSAVRLWFTFASCVSSESNLLFFCRDISAEVLKFVGRLQDVEMVEDGAKHTLVLYNCKVPQTGEVAFTAIDAKCSANLKVKGERSPPWLLSQSGAI